MCYRSKDVHVKGQNTNEMEANAFLDLYDREYGLLLHQLTLADWNYNTDLTSTSKAAKAV